MYARKTHLVAAFLVLCSAVQWVAKWKPIQAQVESGICWQLTPYKHHSRSDWQFNFCRVQNCGPSKFCGPVRPNTSNMPKAGPVYSHEKRRLRGDLIEVYKILTGKEKVNASTFFQQAPTVSTLRGHSMKLFRPRERLNIRKNFFSHRVVSHWNALPQHVVEVNLSTVSSHDSTNIGEIWSINNQVQVQVRVKQTAKRYPECAKTGDTPPHTPAVSAPPAPRFSLAFGARPVPRSQIEIRLI